MLWVLPLLALALCVSTSFHLGARAVCLVLSQALVPSPVSLLLHHLIHPQDDGSPPGLVLGQTPVVYAHRANLGGARDSKNCPLPSAYFQGAPRVVSGLHPCVW